MKPSRSKRKLNASPKKTAARKRKASPSRGAASQDSSSSRSPKSRKSKLGDASSSKSITDYYRSLSVEVSSEDASPSRSIADYSLMRGECPIESDYGSGNGSQGFFGDENYPEDDETLVNIADFLEMNLGECETEVKDETKKGEYGHLYGRSLQRIIEHERNHQDALKTSELKNGRNFSSLFSRDEIELFEKFCSLPVHAIILYARMLCRKKSWHRASLIKYSDVGDNVLEVFKILKENNFVDVNIEDEDLEVQLRLLNKAEIQKLCQDLKIKFGGKKKDCIKAIIKNCKTQKSIFDFCKKDNAPTRLKLFQSRIVEVLGPCVKLNDAVLSSFNRLLLLFSLTHNVEEEKDRWRSTIQMMIEVSRCEAIGIKLFPKYELNPTVIFQCQSDFAAYEKAMNLLSDIEEAIAGNNHEKFTLTGQQALADFKILLKDAEFRGRFEAMPSFLRRFSAGSVYASILTRYCDNFKKKTSAAEIIDITKLLIEQNTYLIRKKGAWYNSLSMAYEKSRKIEDAARTVIQALEDDLVDNVQKLTLRGRASAILKRRENRLQESEVRTNLSNLAAVTTIQEPQEITINATVIEGNKPGRKCMYLEDDENGKICSSVEEQAIRYYKRNGFTEGVHAEGYIIHTIYLLIFFDIIYDSSPPGAFQNPYQERPLDLTSRSFYANRKEAIDKRLSELPTWSMDRLEYIITKVYNENYSLRCAISWRDDFDSLVFAEIAKCIGPTRLTKLCERFVHKYGEARSGFPDLTLWNSNTGECMFVEVKSARDRLSSQQRIWLDFLRQIDLKCEVCHVVPKS